MAWNQLRAIGQGLEVLKGRQIRVAPRKGDLPTYLRGVIAGFFIMKKVAPRLGRVLDPAKAPEGIQVPVAATEFAVRDDL